MKFFCMTKSILAKKSTSSKTKKQQAATEQENNLNSLNSQQRKAVNDMLKMKKGQYYLSGAAGTGKSYTAYVTMLELLRKKRQKRSKGKILILCPTHIAKLQFTSRLPRRLIEGNNARIDLSTVAAFLGSSPQTDKITGQDHFSRGEFRNADGYCTIFVDESSMIGNHELSEISKASKEIPIFYLGDLNQLKPVMSKSGENLLEEMQGTRLTTQMRSGGPVLELCQKLRKKLIYPEQSQSEKDAFGNTASIHVFESRSDMIEDFLKQLKKSQEPWNIAYLAYTNLAVEHVKKLAHETLYSNEIFAIGEYVRLGRPWVFKGKDLGHRGNILQIKKIIGKETKELARDFICPVYRLSVKNIDLGIEGEIECVSPDDQTQFVDLLDKLYKECRKLFTEKRMDDYELARAEVDRLKDLGNLKSPYAQTIHSAQGRTIPCVYIDTFNIAEQGSGRRRLMYVGCSRTQYDLNTIKITDEDKKEMKQRRLKHRKAHSENNLTTLRELW
ncbi:hypothetical protein FAI40_07295 [Acetobacteraceae bacterium]|nr:hypothetical protein FAI40_07295 [Acetobacteraceae bacterium]